MCADCGVVLQHRGIDAAVHRMSTPPPLPDFGRRQSDEPPPPPLQGPNRAWQIAGWLLVVGTAALAYGAAAVLWWLVA